MQAEIGERRTGFNGLHSRRSARGASAAIRTYVLISEEFSGIVMWSEGSGFATRVVFIYGD